MRNKFFVFSMFSLFIIGLLLVFLIGTTSQIGQAQPSFNTPYYINYYNEYDELVGRRVYGCNLIERGYTSNYPIVHYCE